MASKAKSADKVATAAGVPQVQVAVLEQAEDES
jgi:hypothetical protein